MSGIQIVCDLTRQNGFVGLAHFMVLFLEEPLSIASITVIHFGLYGFSNWAMSDSDFIQPQLERLQYFIKFLADSLKHI